MKSKTDFKILVVGLVILLIGGGVAWGAYLMNQSFERKNSEINKKLQPTTLPIIPSNTPVTVPATLSATPITMNSSQSPTITIEGDTGMPELIRSELELKIIRPFVDYYLEAGQGKLLALKISMNKQANQQIYPFLGEAELENKVKIGFVIEKDGNSFKWWKPECMGVCDFSEDYKAKYPDVVKM